MGSYIVRRVIQALVVLIIVSFLAFIVMRLMPGDPILIYMSAGDLDSFTPEQLNKMKAEFGLDKPLMAQYINWLLGVLQGDLGTSIFYHENVLKLILDRLPVTIHLGFLAWLLAESIGMLSGVTCALRRGRWLDTLVTMFANLGITIPVFWLGILMIYLFGLQFGWLPIQGYISPFEDFWLNTKQVIMPVICLSIFPLASTTRQTRSSMLEVTRQDYIRTAWAKGLAERPIIRRHALKNALIPVVTLVGMHVRMIFGGSVLVETVFNIPGMGRLLVSSVFSQEYVVVQSGILIIAIVVTIANIVVDLSYGWLDPRIRYG